MNPPLFPHQHQAAMRIAEGQPTYLGFDMGIGKTRTFIEAAQLRGAQRILVLCPASAVLVWQREIQMWDPAAISAVARVSAHLKMEPIGGKRSYYIVTHGMMSQRNGEMAKAMVDGKPFDMTAIDEAQAYNAPSNIRVNALRKVRSRLGQIVPLSGTPMKNHAGDLFTLLDICWREGLGRMSRAQYEAEFCVVQHRDFQRNGRLVRVIEGSKNLGRLKKMIAPFMVRVRKDEVFKDLPAINWDTVPIPLDPTMIPTADLAALAEIVNSAAVSVGDNSTGTAQVDDVLRALAARVSGGSLTTLRRLLGIAKLRGATEYIDDMLQNLPQNRKVLVFAHHTDVIAALEVHLAEYSPAVLIGQTSASGRAAAVDDFLNDDRCRVFIGNIQAAGTAITLVGPRCKCSDVVFVESSWTPMDNAQAACRVHRIGQKDGVVARMLSAAGTIDDLINALLVRKAREFTQLFDTTTGAPT